MRTVFVAAPAVGHVFPMVPLAWAMRTAGHDVTFITAGDGLRAAQSGLHVIDALPGRTTADMLAEFIRDSPQLFEPLRGDPVAALNQRKAAIVAAWGPFVDAHVELAEKARPDLVVYDPIFGVGALVAAKLGIPAVAHGVSITRWPPELLRDLPAAAPFRRHGLAVPESIGTIDIAPPSLAEGPPSSLRMRFVPYNGGGILPNWLLTKPAKPRVAVTFGTLGPAGAQRYAQTMEAAAHVVEAEFVVTVGTDDASAIGDVPPNVRPTGWVPLSALLRTCCAAVHHGGGTSSLTCCALGIPQLAVPEGDPSTLAEAELLRARGVAHVMRPDELGAAALRELLEDGTLRKSAADLEAEMAALPAPSALVPTLAGLVC